jgi:hypothetical protein
MQPFPPLHDLQRLLSHLIRAPEGVTPGVSALVESGELESHDLSFVIEPNRRMSADQRLDIYATMYFERLHESISEDYPKTRARLGATNFHNLITDYLLAHPPAHYSLREAGRALPDFLGTHRLAEPSPALADLARLEWARVSVFDERDAQPLDRDRLLEASADGPDALSLWLIPAARVLTLDPLALTLWRDDDAPQGDADPHSAGPEKRCVVVWRKEFAVLHRFAEEDEERCLDALAATGIMLPELAELLLKPDAGAERTSERFASLLELWLHNELLASSPLTEKA